jgi:predicted house-cleaning NTP pyrophosphatase (Maf/HAM1 superfamily)
MFEQVRSIRPGSGRQGPPQLRTTAAAALIHKVVQLTLILASSSAIRRQMLDAAGVAYRPVPAEIDEAVAKARIAQAEPLALELAAAKALQVSAAHVTEWVVGSDSVVEVEGRLFDKPVSRDQAAEHLRAFSGKTMRLTSAVALARAGNVDWLLRRRVPPGGPRRAIVRRD